jgi:hypothetical protein
MVMVSKANYFPVSIAIFYRYCRNFTSALAETGISQPWVSSRQASPTSVSTGWLIFCF